MIKEIITDLDILSQRSDEINVRKEGDLFRSTILNIKDTMAENKLTCLSAIQIGVPKRVFTIQFNTSRKVFCNPFITDCKDFTLNRETSPSLPGKTYIVPRYGKIQATYQDPMGKILNMQFVGASAFAFEQMVDSLEGIYPCDFGLEIDEDFDNATDDERAEVIKMYCESMDIRLKELKAEIEEDPELKKMDDAIKFMTAVQTGEVKLEKAEFSMEENKENEVDNTADEQDNN